MPRNHYINKTARLSTPQKSSSLIGQIKSCARDSKSCERVHEFVSRADDKIFHLHVPLGAPYIGLMAGECVVIGLSNCKPALL